MATVPSSRSAGTRLLALAVLIVAVGVGVAAFVGRTPAPSPKPAASPQAPTMVPGAGTGQGVNLEYQVLPKDGVSPDAAAIETVRQILVGRLDAMGVVNTVVEIHGADRIGVQLATATAVDDIRSTLGQTGRVDFIPLPVDRYGSAEMPGDLVALEGAALPSTETSLFSGDQLAEVYPTTDTQGNRAVGFRLTSDAAKLFADWTSANIGKFFAIVLDGIVVSVPLVQSGITSGEGIIAGPSFTAREMSDLVTFVKLGALPFPIREVGSGAAPTPPEGG